MTTVAPHDEDDEHDAPPEPELADEEAGRVERDLTRDWQ